MNFAYKRLLNKPYENEVTLKPTFKMLPAPWTFYTIEKGSIFLIAENLGSVGQRDFFLRTPTLTASNFAAL